MKFAYADPEELKYVNRVRSESGALPRLKVYRPYPTEYEESKQAFRGGGESDSKSLILNMHGTFLKTISLKVIVNCQA